jgi:hypothetical protein
MRTPRASSTSAEPLRELANRLPCLATRAPAAEATMAAAVEMLNVPLASPPVPHVSTRGAGRESPGAKTGRACRRIMLAKPVSSSTVTGRRLNVSSRRTISEVSMRPESNSSRTASASRRDSAAPAATLSRSGWVTFIRVSRQMNNQFHFTVCGWNLYGRYGDCETVVLQRLKPNTRRAFHVAAEAATYKTRYFSSAGV